MLDFTVCSVVNSFTYIF